jgi:DNA-binding SARP family transcriptional activator/tetratricopeptide (TPR) repeat protein
VATIAVRLLGPFEMTLDGRPFYVERGPHRILLAALALDAPRTVPAARLAGYLWGTDQPRRPDTVVATAVDRLRAVLGADSVRADTGGWSLPTDPAQVDSVRFARLVTAAYAPPGLTFELLEEALELWRGDPFTGVDSPTLQRLHGPALDDLHVTTVERLADYSLAEGHPNAHLARLRELAVRHPLREPLWARLISVLVASGQTAEASGCFEQIRQRLAETVGSEPGADLQRLRRQLVERSRVTALAAPATPARSTLPLDAPHTLPPRPDGFAGRRAELAALNNLVAGRHQAPPTAQTVCTIHGAAGVGKTALALEWAHRVGDEFPDGQVYLDLRGSGVDPPVDPAAAVASLLRAVGVPAARTPSDTAGQIALLHALLADRRMLLVLDNVDDDAQARPLLPGASSVVVLIGRNPLPSLRTREGAREVALRRLDPEDTRALLAYAISPARLSDETTAADRIGDSCGGIPLALRLVAAQAATDPELELARIADDVTRARARQTTALDHDPTLAASAALAWAYARLPAETAAAFRCLGLHPTGEFSLDSVAALAGVSSRAVRAELDRLVTAHLLESGGAGRYRLHALARSYAIELAGADNPVTRIESTRRLVDWCLRAVARADDVLGEEPDIDVDRPDPSDAPRLWTRPEVAAWFEAERDLLVATVLAATEHELYRRGHQLAYLLRPLFHWRQRCEEYVPVAELGVECARRLNDDPTLSRALRTLGVAYAWAARGENAEAPLLEAVAHAERTGELGQVAIAISDLGIRAGRAGDADEAIRYHREAIDISRRSGDRRLIGATLLNMGFTQIESDDCEAGIATTQEALGLFVEIGAEQEAAWALGNLANAFHRTLRLDAAEELAERSLVTLRRLGDVDATAEVLVTLGRVRRATGRVRESDAAWQEADELIGPEHWLADVVAGLRRDHSRVVNGYSPSTANSR